LTLRAIYYYRLEPVIIIIIAFDTPQFMIIASNLAVYRFIFRLDTRRNLIIALNLVISIWYRPVTPQFMIIALNLVISILLSP
jgi:hypothetical protein